MHLLLLTDIVQVCEEIIRRWLDPGPSLSSKALPVLEGKPHGYKEKFAWKAECHHGPAAYLRNIWKELKDWQLRRLSPRSLGLAG